MNRFLIGIGLFLTSVYMGFIVNHIRNQLSEISKLTLNNFGDFLAGIAGPIAVFWIILSFMQQGIALRQNTEALNLQNKEINNMLSALNEERIRQTIAAKPLFIPLHRQIEAGVSGINMGNGNFLDSVNYELIIENRRNFAADIRFIFEPPVKESSYDGHSTYIPCNQALWRWEPLKQHRLRWSYQSDSGEAKDIVCLKISYLDSNSQPGEQLFRLTPKSVAEKYNSVEIESINT